ncbi:MAG: hypothetical protein IJI45_11465 [Anaerolineaceae bacterium]|nr:hypothetical protein [Anaerolineaceae bacterium]
MRAVSISIKEKKDNILQYTVKWQKEPNGEELTCKSCEIPRPELIATMRDFAQFIPIITLIPKDRIRDVIIAGATFVYQNANIGLCLGTQVELANGFCLEFKTPVKRIDPENPDLEQSTNWEDRYTKLAIKLGEEILLYAQGKRAQTELNFEKQGAEDGENAILPPGGMPTMPIP